MGWRVIVVLLLAVLFASADQFQEQKLNSIFEKLSNRLKNDSRYVSAVLKQAQQKVGKTSQYEELATTTEQLKALLQKEVKLLGAVSQSFAESHLVDEAQTLDGVSASVSTNNLLETIKNADLTAVSASLEQSCNLHQPIGAFGISIVDCSVTLGYDRGAKHVKVSGTVTIFDRPLSVLVDVKVAATANPDGSLAKSVVVKVSLPTQFKLSDIVTPLKGTVMDDILLLNPELLFVSSNDNDYGYQPGIAIRGSFGVNPSSTNQAIQTISQYLPAGASVTVLMQVTGATSIADLRVSTGRQFLLKASATNLNVGSRIACPETSFTIQTQQPFVAVDADCNIQIQDDSPLFSLHFEASGVKSLSVSGQMKTSVSRAFGIADLSIDSAGVDVALSNGQFTKAALQGKITFQGTQFQFSGDFVAGSYSFGVADMTLARVLQWLKFNSIAANAPQMSLQQLTVEITKKKGEPAHFKLHAVTTNTVFDKTIVAKSNLDLSSDKVQISGELQNTFTMGPVTISQPGVSITIYQASGFDVMFHGITSFWELRNLKVVLGFGQAQGKTGFLALAALGDAFKLSTMIPQLRGTVLDGIAFRESQIQISTYPVAGPDGVAREGVMFKSIIVLGDNSELGGIKKLFGGKVAELPVGLYLGATVSGQIDPRGLQIVTGIPVPPAVSSKYVKLLSPIGLQIGLVPPSFGLAVGIEIRLPKDEQPLGFQLTLKFDPIGAVGTVETTNQWVAPFGFKPITVKKVALDIGITFTPFIATGIPSRLGIMGEFEFPGVGNVGIATLADLQNSQFVLQAYIDSFGIQSILALFNAFGVPKINSANVPDIGFKKVKLYVSPTGGKIASVQFAAGLNLEGEFWLFGNKFAEIKVLITATDGITAYGHVSAIKIGPLDIGESVVDLRLTPSQQYLYVKASISIQVVFQLFKRQVDIRMSKDEIYFKYDTGIYYIEASAIPKDPASLMIGGAFNGVTLSEVAAAATKIINAIGNEISAIKGELSSLTALKDSATNKVKNFYLPNICASTGATTATAAAVQDLLDSLEYEAELPEENELSLADARTQGIFDSIKRGARRIGDRIVRAVSDGWSETRKLFESAGKNIDKVWDKIKDWDVSKVRKEFGDAADTVISAARKKCSSIITELNNLKATAQNYATQASNKANELASKTKDIVGEAIEKGLNKVNIGISSITFRAALRDIQSTGGISITVKAVFLGKEKVVVMTLRDATKIKDIASDLAKKIIGK